MTPKGSHCGNTVHRPEPSLPSSGKPAWCFALVDPMDYWDHHSKAHADALDLQTVQRLCDVVFDVGCCESHRQRLADGKDVRIPLKKQSTAYQLDIKEEVLNSLLPLSALYPD